MAKTFEEVKKTITAKMTETRRLLDEADQKAAEARKEVAAAEKELTAFTGSAEEYAERSYKLESMKKYISILEKRKTEILNGSMLKESVQEAKKEVSAVFTENTRDFANKHRKALADLLNDISAQGEKEADLLQTYNNYAANYTDVVYHDALELNSRTVKNKYARLKKEIETILNGANI